MEKEQKKEGVNKFLDRLSHPNILLGIIVVLIFALIIIIAIDIYKLPKQVVLPICTDSDNGKDAYLLGIVTNPDGRLNIDSCAGNSLVEYYCDRNNMSNSVKVACAFECKEGVCVKQEIAAGETVQCPTQIIEVNQTTTVCEKEICYDGIDNDCDAQIDEDCPKLPVCGDGLCLYGETASTCAVDCTCGKAPECFKGEKKCVGNGSVVCDNHDDDACNEWGYVSVCKEGYSCENGDCVGKPLCTAECQIGERTCADGGFALCDYSDTTGCYKYSQVYNCAQGYSCEDGDCVIGCKNDLLCTGASSNGCVDSNTRYFCQQKQDSLCYGKVTESCGENSYCDRGQCIALPLCQDDKDCLRPRTIGCIDDTTRYYCEKNSYGCWQKNIVSCPTGTTCDYTFADCRVKY